MSLWEPCSFKPFIPVTCFSAPATQFAFSGHVFFTFDVEHLSHHLFYFIFGSILFLGKLAKYFVAHSFLSLAFPPIFLVVHMPQNDTGYSPVH